VDHDANLILVARHGAVHGVFVIQGPDRELQEAAVELVLEDAQIAGLAHQGADLLLGRERSLFPVLDDFL
jgi:hypothetical protein